MNRKQKTTYKHNRRSIRLPGYDYSQPGAYYITICAHDRRLIFGNIVSAKINMNPIGGIVAQQWDALPQRFPNVVLDSFVVMPNHVHMIFMIVDTAPCDGSHDENAYPSVKLHHPPTVGKIVGAFKSLCVHHSLKYIKRNEPKRFLGKLWQRNYWEHVVRNDDELMRIKDYLENNPAEWDYDRLNSSACNVAHTRESCIPCGREVCPE